MTTSSVAPVAPASPLLAQLRLTLRGWPVIAAIAVVVALVLIAIFAPFLGTSDPSLIDASQRLKPISAAHWLGTDAFGRDVYSRVLYGARISLTVGLGTVVIALSIGLLIGVVAGYFRWADAIVMRVMDGMMAIPGILLAIALVSLSGASLFTVLIAIAIPEIPRVVRMVRSVMLSVRTESFVEAATILGTRVPLVMWRHMMPSTLAPLIVQGTYIFASAILTEAILSFLGAGIPPETPSWGNAMAEGRVYFMLLPGLVLYPGVLVSLTVLSVNVLGDALRDALDPRMAKRV
jgi:peptide/nickel transport system permease protein